MNITFKVNFCSHCGTVIHVTKIENVDIPRLAAIMHQSSSITMKRIEGGWELNSYAKD